MVTNGACIIFCIISFVIGCWLGLAALALCVAARDNKSEDSENDERKTNP